MKSLQTSGPALSLLIVEDDKEAREVISFMVSKKYFSNLTVYSAENGRMGLDLFKEHTPDIIVTDINMPEMDGIQMASEIKRIKADTRIIILTGYSNTVTLKNRIGEVGINAYMVKPVIFGQLFAAIDKCIEEMTSFDLLSQERE